MGYFYLDEKGNRSDGTIFRSEDEGCKHLLNKAIDQAGVVGILKGQ